MQKVERAKGIRGLGLRHLGVDPRSADLGQIDEAAGRLSKADRVRLVAKIKRFLSRREIRNSEEQRISAATLLLTLLPESEKYVLELFETKLDLSAYEIHFSLFCFLDFVQQTPEKHPFAAGVPKLIEGYLNNLKADQASAGWMAAHLMEDHWKGNAGLGCLLRVASHGKYVAGRRIAIHHVTTRLRDSKGSRRRVLLHFLEKLGNTDSNARIRLHSRWELKRLRKTHLTGRTPRRKA